MYNKLKLLGICLLLFFLSCKNNKKANDKNNVNKLKTYCQIPLKIENYLNENKEDWSIVDLDDFDKELLDFLSGKLKYVDNQTCPYFVYGDFNNNKEKDFAIIVENKNKKDEEDDFASLLIFHDYESNFIPPFIPLKDAVDTESAMIKSAIYSVREYGILSYLETGNICGVNVVDINYFTKSGFFVYWNKEKNKYRFLPSYETEEILCDIIKGSRSKYIVQWQGAYSFSFGRTHMSESSEGNMRFYINGENSYYSNYNKFLNPDTGEVIDSSKQDNIAVKIVNVTKDTLQLQDSGGDIYKIYKDEQGYFNASGHKIYMLSPPNESYLLTKEK